MRNPGQKLTKTYWVARWCEDGEDCESTFEGPHMEAECRLFAQSKALGLQKAAPTWQLGTYDYKTEVKVTEVTLYEEDLGTYSYNQVMQDMVKPRPDYAVPSLTPDEPEPAPVGLDLSDEIPF